MACSQGLLWLILLHPWLPQVAPPGHIHSSSLALNFSVLLGFSGLFLFYLPLTLVIPTPELLVLHYCWMQNELTRFVGLRYFYFYFSMFARGKDDRMFFCSSAIYVRRCDQLDGFKLLLTLELENLPVWCSVVMWATAIYSHLKTDGQHMLSRSKGFETHKAGQACWERSFVLS